MFEAIRNAHPDAMISLLTIPALQRIARAAPYFDQVAAIPDLSKGETRKDFVKQLKTAGYQRVYDLAADDAGKKIFGAMGMFRPKWFTAAPASKRKARALPHGHHDTTPRFDRLTNDAGLELEERLPDFNWALAARKDSANMKPSWYGISGAYALLLPRPGR